MTGGFGNQSQALQRCVEGFIRQYGHEPEWLSHAPGRVNLIGEHIDYNDGWVLPTAIDRRLAMAARVIDRPEILLHSEQQTHARIFSLEDAWQPKGDWTDYLIGVMKAFLDRGARPCGLELSLASDIPVGAGLSSSAALECSIASLMEELWEHRLDPVEKVILCQQVEHAFVGMPCGIMDQSIVTLAKKNHFLLLDCMDRSHQHIAVPSNFPTLLILDTKVKHALVEGDYARRRQECHACLEALGRSSWRGAEDMASTKLESLPYPARARHVISEMARTLQAVDCLQKGAWEALGDLLYQSHASLRNDFEVSCPELDWLVEALQSLGPSAGVWGGRMTGGGFGGCVVALVEPLQVERILGRLQSGFHAQFGHPPDGFVSTPASGCQIERPGPLHRLDHPDRFGRTPRRLSP